MRRIVIGVSGASGMPVAASLLRHVSKLGDVEVHLVVTEGARRVLAEECGEGVEILEQYAHRVYGSDELGSSPASGSWQHEGMIVCPCSMSSLAAIATGAGHNLVHRAADVTLKERRPLVLVVRETPFSLVHLRNMTLATEAGAVIMPFMPAFYTGLTNLEDMLRNFTGRVLDQLRIPHSLCSRWERSLF